MKEAPVIHDVARAAERALVSEAVILQWIREGMKATPVGRVGKRGPRDYRIFDSWLLEFMERRAGESRVNAPSPAPRNPRSNSPAPTSRRLVIPKAKESV